MEFGLPGWGGHAVVAALVVATNLAPMAGLDGLADYTGAAACALATGSDMQDSACRAGAQATDRAAADTATDSAATTGHDRASGDTAAAPTGVVADRRPADCPSTSPAPDGQGADHDAAALRTPRRTRGHHHDGRRGAGRGRRVGPPASRHRGRRRRRRRRQPCSAASAGGARTGRRRAGQRGRRRGHPRPCAAGRRGAGPRARGPDRPRRLVPDAAHRQAGRPRHRREPRPREVHQRLLHAQRRARRRRVLRPRRRRHHQEQPLPALGAAGDERQRQGRLVQHQRHAHPRCVRGDHPGPLGQARGRRRADPRRQGRRPADPPRGPAS